MEWVTGDSPVVLANQGLTRLHSLRQLAVYDASTFHIPLGRTVAMTIYTKDCPPDQFVQHDVVQRINWLMWRNCHRFLACHPSADPERLLATTIEHPSRVA
jgi:hypothetical protein